MTARGETAVEEEIVKMTSMITFVNVTRFWDIREKTAKSVNAFKKKMTLNDFSVAISLGWLAGLSVRWSAAFLGHLWFLRAVFVTPAHCPLVIRTCFMPRLQHDVCTAYFQICYGNKKPTCNF